MKSKLPKVYGCSVSYVDKLDMTSKVLNVYACVVNINKGENHLRPRLVQVLAFYLLMSYCNETKQLIQESLGITLKNLNQINSELTKKGYLLRDSRNHRRRHLSKELEIIKNYFVDSNEKTKKIFLMDFLKK